MQAQVDYFIVASGQTVQQSHFGVRGAEYVGLWSPTLTSCQLFLHVAPQIDEPNSSQFVRLGKADGTGDFAWSVGVGSAAIALTEPMQPFACARVVLSAAQTDVRTFAVIRKF